MLRALMVSAVGTPAHAEAAAAVAAAAAPPAPQDNTAMQMQVRAQTCAQTVPAVHKCPRCFVRVSDAACLSAAAVVSRLSCTDTAAAPQMQMQMQQMEQMQAQMQQMQQYHQLQQFQQGQQAPQTGVPPPDSPPPGVELPGTGGSPLRAPNQLVRLGVLCELVC